MHAAGGSAKGGTAVVSRLRPVKNLERCTISAVDGDIGTVEDLYFEDQGWTARYLVVDTGGWLSGRKVLIPPRALREIDTVGQRVFTTLTKQKVQESPPVEEHRPVSRPYEMQLYGHYGYPYYWVGPYRWGATPLGYVGPYPAGAPPGAESMSPAVAEELAARERQHADPHLQSVRDVRGHKIRATDGELGHVEDFLLEEDSLAIRYMVVDPVSWWPGAHVLIPTDWITSLSWSDALVDVDVTKQQVREAPQYDPAPWIDREYEARYHRHYGRPGYWERPDEDWRL